VGELESLKTITSFSFFSNDIEDRVDKFGTFGIMSFGPVVSCSGLTEDEIVWSEQLTEWTSSN